jgi:hypothetical protein
MDRSCPTCGAQNIEGAIFCIRCGGQMGTTVNLAGSPQSPNAPHGGANPGNSSGYAPFSPGYQALGAKAQAGAMASSSGPAQMGSRATATTDSMSRHAFAGHGTLITHHSWLLNGSYTHTTTLRSAVQDILGRRNIQSLTLNNEKLQEHGYWIEEREYLTLKRGIATIFVYIAPAGQDLYISRATTVLLSFDVLRIGLLLFALADVFLSPSLLQGVLGSMTSSLANNVGAIAGLIVPFLILAVIFAALFLPSILFLGAFLLASFKHWFVEKDFWVYLRRGSLNDFEIDDIMLLEHATDETVQAAVKQLNLDSSRIVPPAQGYQTKRRVRII